MRAPNPWVTVPVVLAAIAGGVVGYFVTEASCAPGGCVVAAGLVAAAVSVAAGLGIGVIGVLALKSLDEFRSHRDREILTEVAAEDVDRPGPPTC